MAYLSLLLLLWWLASAQCQTDVIIQTMPSVVIGYEDLDITCRPHPSWTIQSITRIQLYKDTRGTIGSPLSELVFMYLDLTFLKEEFQWSDLSVKERGEATGALSPTVDSFMRLTIPANTTLCEDAANYRCEISGTNFGAPSSRLLDFSVTGLGKADQIYGLDVVLQSGFSSATGRYDYNSVLVITCNATIGLPPLDMNWCAKTSNMSDLSPFPNADQISTSGVMADGACQNRQVSTLVYHVTEVDMGTQIMCEVTNVSDCVTNQLNVSYSFDVVFGRVNMNATTNITLRQDDVEVFCYQATTGEGLKSVDRMEIFRDNTSVVSAVLENGNTAIEWWDNSLEGRSLLTADITMPSSAFIKLTIPANASECSDIAAYRCQLTATSVAETVVNDYMDISIYSETLPEDISPLRIQDSAGDSVPPGGAVQVGETITIVCNGTVGRPAQSMRWCIRKYGGIFVNYPHNDDVITSDVNVADACQNFMNSTLTYDVTSGDIETTFMCEIGGEVCGDGILASEVSIYAVDIAIRSRVPEEIYAGVDDLLIRCSQTAAGIGLLRDPEIRLYRNSSVINDTAVLSLTFDKATNQSTITWFDEDFEARAAAFGDVSDLTSAYLNVSVNANNVTCNDGGNYKCVLNGYIGNGVFSDEDADFLDVKVRPEHMAEIIVKTNTNETTDQRAFPVGSQLTMTCNSTIGIPPLALFWCVRRESDDKFILIGQETSSGPVISGSCQNRQTSDINLNVTGMDRDTLVQCEVGNVSICNSGIVARRTRIHAVDLALTTDVTSTVSSGDSLNITCYQSASGLGKLRNTGITLYRNTSNAIYTADEPVVSLTFNSTTNISTIIWYDDTVENRATIDGDVMDPESAYLSLVINNVTCLDGGFYWFEMTGVTPTDDWHTRGNTTQIHIDVKPDDMESIYGVVDGRHVTGRTSLSVGTSLMLSCNATVGNPPVDLHWCVRRVNNKEFIRYTGCSIQQEATFVGPCQYTRTSDVYINVTSEDAHSIFMCEAGNDWICDGGCINEVFEIFAVDLALTTEVTSTVSSGDTMNITCYQSASGLGILRNIGITLYRNTSGAISATDDPVISLEFNSTTNISTILWYDDTVEGRATIDGDVMDPESAYLSLVINNVTCLDGGFYRCEMTGVTPTDDWHTRGNTTQIHIDVKPDDMETIHGVVDGRHVTGRTSLSVGTSLMLSCNATVGNPPVDLHWCVRRVNNTEFIRYTGCSIQQEATFVGPCQYTRTSDVYINVTSEDAHTIFMCEAGNDWICDGGYINEVFELFAVDLALTTEVTSTVSSGDTMNITCYQSASGLGILRNIGITLYRNTSGAISATDDPVISLEFNSTTNISTILWYDDTVEGRATIDGDVMDPESAYLSLVINNVTCLDGGFYRCEMTGVTPTDDWHTRGNTTQIHIDVKPDDMEKIHGVVDGRHVTGRTSLSVGTSLMLSCNATVGNPPVDLHWCVRRVNNTEFIRYTGWSIQQEATFVGPCQYTRTSDVYINVTSEDAHTIFMCEAGNDWICDGGYINEVFELFAVDLALTTDVTSTVSSGDTINITCYQSASGLGKLSNIGITLYRNTSDAISATDEPVVSLTCNSTTNILTILWYDDTVEDRATIDGDVMDPESAYLSLVINNVTCLDGGFYQCEMTGVTPTDDWHTRGNTTQIHIDVKPGDMEPIYGVVDGRHVTGRTSLSVGTSLMLSCNATVGNPPVDLHWCVRRVNNTEFIRYTGWSIQQEATFVGPCQYSRTSDVFINVTSEDAHTIFMCEAGNDWICDGGYINEVFELFAVSADLTMDATTYVTSGQDSLSIVCMLSGEILGDIQDLIFILSRAPISGNITALQMIVSVTYNSSTNQSDITWFDLSTQQRASVHGSVVDMVTAYINLTIDKAEVTCSDSGLYSCELVGVSPTYERFMWREEARVEVYVKPASISDVIAQTDTGLYSKEGVFPVGTGATLFCNSTVGDPPMGLHWCVRKEGQFPVVYEGFSNDTGPDPIGECQFTRSSSLLYTVKSEDTQTDFICVVGSNGTCGIGHLSSAFTLYAAVISVNAESTPLATSGLDNITVTCSVSGLRLLYDWMFSIYHNTSRDTEEEIIIISLLHAGKTNSTDVVWREPELQTRADYSIVLTDIDTMKLELSFQGEFVTCLDSGLYRCEISGNTTSGGTEKQDNTTSVTVIVLPDKIEEVNGKGDTIQANGGGIFTVNSSLVLTCNSSLGNPPMNMHWCTKMYNESHWIPYPNTSHINQTYSLSDSCNYWSISTLTSEVKDTDISTLYRCEVGDNSTCGQSVLNSTFAVYGVDVDMVIQGTKSVIGGIDDLQITCSQNATGIGLIENTSMVIYHQPQGSQWYLLVTLTNNVSSGNDVITWHNTGVDELWSANGSLAPLVTSYLQLTLKHANCRNGGAYECVLQGQVGVYGFTKKDRLDVEVQALPDRIEPIEGQLDGSVLAVEGRFPVSRTVSITCNSTVGNPPLNLFWRFKRANDTDYTFINGSDLLEQAGTGSCQLRRISELLWTVTSADEKTVFNCIVGATPNSAYLNATFTIIAIPCDGDCSIPEPSTPSEGVTSAVIVASVVAPLLLLLLLIGLFGFWKFPGFRTLLFKRKYFGPKVKPQDFGRDTALDLNGVGTSAPPTGTSAPPTGTSLVNGSVK